MKKLKNIDSCEAADVLGCAVASIKAVASVESGGRGGFDSKGRVLLRFEGHKFRKFTGRRFDRTHPTVSYRYHRSHRGCGKHHGYSGFNIAMKLDPIAAMKSCSIGMFQPMVFNYHEMGYTSVHEMWNDFKKGEREQLLAFVRLIQYRGLDDELRRAKLVDFARFARSYNGADYKANNYDQKMFTAFRRFSKQNINCKSLLANKKRNDSQELTEENIGEQIDTWVKETSSSAPVVNPASENETEIPEAVEDSVINAQENSEESSQEASSSEQMTDQPQTQKTKVIVKDDDAEVETEEGSDDSPSPTKKVAIEKPAPKGFISTIRREITGLVGGNIAFQAVIDGLSQVKSIGLSPTFWTIIGSIALVGSLIYMVYRWFDFQQDSKRDVDITNKLVDANSTPDNQVYLVDSSLIDSLDAKEFEVIRR